MDKKTRFAALLLIFVMALGMIPVSAASKKIKPDKPSIRTEVTGVTSEKAKVTIKIEKTNNADGYEIYEKTSADKAYKKVKTLKESGDEVRECTIDCSLSNKSVSFKVRAYKGSVYGKYSLVSKVKLSDYKDKSGTDKPGSKRTKTSSKSTMKLTIETSRKDSNNIGNEWTYEYKVNGKKAKTTGGEYTLSVGDKVTVSSQITENDSIPDVGESTKTYTVKEEDLKSGFSVSLDVTVTENAGRNKGKSASYKVNFKFKAK